MFFHTALSVSNLEKSRKFYETCFSLTFIRQAERKELGVKYIQLSDERGTVLELFQHHEPHPLTEDLMDFRGIGIKHIAFGVDNVEQAVNLCTVNGAHVIRDVAPGISVKQFAFVADPDGIPIEIAER